MSLLSLLLWIMLTLLLLLCLAFFYLLARLKGLSLEMKQSNRDQSVLLDDHFDRENSSLLEVERQLGSLSRQLDQSRSGMKNLDDKILDLQQVLGSAKFRGPFGEVHMENLIRDVLGKSSHLFKPQYHLNNGKICDGAFFLPDQEKILCIDSKFPLDNYRHLADKPTKGQQAAFIRNMKSHIDAIASKYINEQTLPVALLFLPSESMYAYICAKEEELFTYAAKKRVLLTSPTTLIGILNILLNSARNFYQVQNSQRIFNSLEELCSDLREMNTLTKEIQIQQKSLQKNISTLSGMVDNIHEKTKEIVEGNSSEDFKPQTTIKENRSKTLQVRPETEPDNIQPEPVREPVDLDLLIQNYQEG